MYCNNLLSLAVPTYNNAHFLDNWLEYHIPIVRMHNIRIIISDNNSKDETAVIVQKHMRDYTYIEYHRNEENIGYDRNCEMALKYANTEYVWLLGDTDLIPENGIEYVLDLILKSTRKYDAIIVNAAYKGVYDINEKDYFDQNELLYEIGWHTAFLAVIIYNSRIIHDRDFTRYYDTNFIHLGILFDCIAKKEVSVHFAKNIMIKRSNIKDGIFTKKNEWWSKDYFKVTLIDWPNLIFSLPPIYRVEAKLKTIKNWAEKTGGLNLRFMIYLRSINRLNFKIYKQYSKMFRFVGNYPKFLLALIALFPISGAKILVSMYYYFRR